MLKFFSATPVLLRGQNNIFLKSMLVLIQEQSLKRFLKGW